MSATPAPLDPSAVKSGDTVTVRFIETGEEFTTKAYRPADIKAPNWVSVLGWPLVKADGQFGLAVKFFELLDHQPAPEPEPEWLFEFKGEEGPEGDEHWARRFPSRSDALRSMIESANLDELNDFEGPVSFSVYTEETGPAESRLVVIDPAAARKALEDNGWGEHETNEILHELGIEVAR